MSVEITISSEHEHSTIELVYLIQIILLIKEEGMLIGRVQFNVVEDCSSGCCT